MKPPGPAPATAGSADDNGGLREVSTYDTPPLYFKPAAGEALIRTDAVASWIPGSGNGGAGDDSLDVAVVTAGGKVMAVFTPKRGARSSLPFAVSAEEVDPMQVMIEERGQHRAMIRVDAMESPDAEGDIEAYLVGWDAAKHAPVTVEHYSGKSEKLPAWAVPAPA